MGETRFHRLQSAPKACKMFADAVKPSSCPARISSAGNARGVHPHSPRSTTNTSCMPASSMGGQMGIFGDLDVDVVIKKIADIIMDNSVKPEQWAMTEEGFDKSWMPIEALQEP
ncbi:hypothetical protein B0H14DRAFT_2569245 [Mycena olivaceomarginata]|nr:hypothetical protein B0H14DRAFT_2569245 [Mycena olivaceomarginata]